MDRQRRDLKRGSLEDRSPPKQAASPAQEATRTHIASLEAQLRRLKSSTRSDQKTMFQVRCVEEELKKAHSKLRRLLNEAERQRRRRERLRGGGAGSYEYEAPPDEAIMATLKSCTRFQDLVRELNTLGFTLQHNDDFMDEGVTMPEVDGVKVEVELIEGDEELGTSVKVESPESPNAEAPMLMAAQDNQYENCNSTDESYRQWFERQAEAQHQWEERLMREQMEMARSVLESVTTTFVQGIQQVLSTFTASRTFRPYSPNDPQSS